MNAKRLLDLYDRVADAPDAIAGLRRFVLNLAVRGKLVPQDPRDEHASELLKLVETERKERIRRGKIRRSKPLASIDDVPYDPPFGWVWIPLGETGNIFTGNSINAQTREQLEKEQEGRPFIATKDVGYGLDRIDYANGLLVEFSDERFKIAQADSVLICAEGGSAGRKTSLTDREICFGNKLLANETWSVVSSRFVLYIYLSDFFYAQFSEKMTGVIGGISIRNFIQLPFPLPPLAEQRRIVAKVDELMALLDWLETARTAREATRDRLTAASLARLTAPETEAEDFPAHARFVLDALPALTARSDQIKQLRQNILKLAVRGKLVPQDPSDKPATELLKRVAAEKSDQISSRRKRKAGPATFRHLSVSVPETWAWGELGDISLLLHYGYTASASKTEKDVRLLRITDIQDDRVDWSSVPGCKIDSKTFSKYALEPGDLLIARTGGTIGKTFLVSEVPVKSVFASYLIRVQPAHSLYAAYLKLFCGSDVYWDQLRLGSRGGAQPNVNGKTLGNMKIPLPPLAEQHRIVAKVDELMALLDRLEASLATADITRQRLLKALLHEALTPDEKREAAA